MHFVHDEVIQEELDIQFTPRVDWGVDFFTKPLSITWFLKLKAKLKLKESPILLEGACEGNLSYV